MKNRKKKVAVATLLVVLLFAPAFVRAYVINGPSMAPTLWFGDRVVAFLAAYDFRVPYTDFVLFRVADPGRCDLILYFDTAKQNVAVKRVVGAPGDEVELRENAVLVNGVAVEQLARSRDEYAAVPAENELGELVMEERFGGESYAVTYTRGGSELSDYGPVVVPEGQYFLLGDNRDRSGDSRVIGPIERERIRGRIFFGARGIDY